MQLRACCLLGRVVGPGAGSTCPSTYQVDTTTSTTMVSTGLTSAGGGEGGGSSVSLARLLRYCSCIPRMTLTPPPFSAFGLATLVLKGTCSIEYIGGDFRSLGRGLPRTHTCPGASWPRCVVASVRTYLDSV